MMRALFVLTALLFAELTANATELSLDLARRGLSNRGVVEHVDFKEGFFVASDRTVYLAATYSIESITGQRMSPAALKPGVKVAWKYVEVKENQRELLRATQIMVIP